MGRPWTVAEAADYLSVTPDTVRRWCQTGQLGHHKLGGRTSQIRIPPEAIEVFLARGEVGAKCSRQVQPPAPSNVTPLKRPTRGGRRQTA